MSKKVEMIGRKFGRLTVIAESSQRGNRGQLKYECICDCGKKTTAMGEALRRRKILSCGCLQRERASEANKTHGGCCSGENKRGYDKLYPIWQGMKDRCFNPNNTEYRHYGGRGITVCDEWLDYVNFRNFMLSVGFDPSAPSKQCTIERIDVNGNYCPENCTVIPLSEQSNNRTCTVWITANGKTMTITQWTRELGVSESMIIQRIKRGMTPEEAVTLPPTKFVKFTVDGETHTTKEWAQILNIPWNTLRDRMRRNGKQEELEKIVREKRNKRSN